MLNSSSFEIIPLGFWIIVSSIFGLVFGSFFNVVALRIPLNQSISFPPSHCTNCDHRLKSIDLIPVLSYLFLRGSCRYCKVRITPLYAIGEAVTALVYGFLTWELGPSKELVVALFFVSILIIITISDLKFMLIPNKIVLFGSIIALIIRLFYHPLPFWNYAIAAFVGSGFLYILAWLSEVLLKKEGMGGGDIKLYVFLGLMLGIKLTLLSIFIASLVGSMIGIMLLIMKIRTREQTLPFGPFIAFGAFVVYLWGDSWLGYYLEFLSQLN